MVVAAGPGTMRPALEKSARNQRLGGSASRARCRAISSTSPHAMAVMKAIAALRANLTGRFMDGMRRLKNREPVAAQKLFQRFRKIEHGKQRGKVHGGHTG